MPHERGDERHPLTYDHIMPTSRDGLTTFDNVCLACRTCNEFKTNTTPAVDAAHTGIYSPVPSAAEPLAGSLRLESRRDEIEGTTALDRPTVVALRMNHALIVAARHRWCAVGWHPPAMEPKRR